jgi:hypothetical protein
LIASPASSFFTKPGMVASLIRAFMFLLLK